MYVPCGVVAARRGERDEMQDAHVILDSCKDIFDGRPRPPHSLSYYGMLFSFLSKLCSCACSCPHATPQTSLCSITLLSFHGCPFNCVRVVAAVFDGHAGARAAEFAATHLHQIIAARLPLGVLQGVSKEALQSPAQVACPASHGILTRAHR